MQNHCGTLTLFDVAVMTMNFKSCLVFILETVRCRNLIMLGTLVGGVGVQHHVTLFDLKVSQSLYCVTYGVVNYFPGLWGTGISNAIFHFSQPLCIGCSTSQFH